MKLLNEPIARRANAEDLCTGHFWESRFRSQALLDERAIAAAMVYVDLNPIRAGIAKTLESSDYTSVARRLRERDIATSHTAPMPEHLSAPGEIPAHETEASARKLKPIAGLLANPLLDISEQHYIELVAWSASIPRPGKNHLESPTAALHAIGSDAVEWQAQFSAIRCGWRAVGGSEQVRALAERIGQHRFRQRTRRSGESPPQTAAG